MGMEDMNIGEFCDCCARTQSLCSANKDGGAFLAVDSDD